MKAQISFQQLKKVKQSLNEYSKIINSEYGDWGETIHDIIWSHNSKTYSKHKKFPFSYYDVPDNKLCMDDDINKLTYVKGEYQKLFVDTHIDNCPFSKIDKVIDDPYEIRELTEKIEQYSDKLNSLEKEKKSFHKSLLSIDIKEYLNNELISKFYDTNKNLDNNTQFWDILKIALNDKIKDIISPYISNKKKLIEVTDNYNKFTDHLGTIFEMNQISIEDAKQKEEIRSIIPILKNTWMLSFLSSDWRNANSYYKGLLRDSKAKYQRKDITRHLIDLLKYHNNKDTIEHDIMSRNKADKSYEESLSQSDLSFNLEDLINKININNYLTIVTQCNNLPEDFREQWLKLPESIISCYEYYTELLKHHKDILKLFDSMNITLSESTFNVDVSHETMLKVLEELSTSYIPPENNAKPPNSYLNTKLNLLSGSPHCVI